MSALLRLAKALEPFEILEDGGGYLLDSFGRHICMGDQRGNDAERFNCFSACEVCAFGDGCPSIITSLLDQLADGWGLQADDAAIAAIGCLGDRRVGHADGERESINFIIAQGSGLFG